MADKGIWKNSFKVTTQYSNGGIKKQSVSGDVVVTFIHACFNRAILAARHSRSFAPQHHC